MYIQVKATHGHKGVLHFTGQSYPCALGKSGVTQNKTEGDHASPIGQYPLRSLYYRADRIAKPETSLECIEIQPNDGWCDDPAHPLYNQKVQLPFDASHETLWREDHLYDVVVVLGHNDAPAIPGNGSCIFMHVAQPDYCGTEGCVALSIQDLLVVLTSVRKDTMINISSGD
jgi:L,D-peptidoglycan transpeptidase YkuD (ErfK/YbiS/YcfS/YnhG family)